MVPQESPSVLCRSTRVRERVMYVKRVLHVIPSVAARYGGPSQAVLGMCRALRKAQIDAVIATTDADGPERLHVPLGTWTSFEGVPALFFPRQWSESLKYSRPLARWMGAHVADFDLVHIHAVFSHACIAAANCSHSLHVPYIVSPHGTLDPWSMRQKPLRKRLMWRLGFRRMLGGSAAVHYTTAEEKHAVEQSLALTRGVVVPLGLDESTYVDDEIDGRDSEHFRQRFRLGRDPYLLTLSRLHPKKRLGPFMEAFLNVTRSPELRPWRLVLAGDGDAAYKHSLAQLARAAGADDEHRVIFPGWLDGEDKLEALRGASLMAMPSSQENFGVSLIESLISGVPVLVSRHVNLASDIAAYGAGWVVDLDRQSLESGLRSALADPAEQRRRGCAGRKLVLERFTWTAVVKDLINLYTAAAANSSPSGNCWTVNIAKKHDSFDCRHFDAE